jgi:hypothetical protein
LVDLPPLQDHVPMLPPRTPWQPKFPDVVVHSTLAARDGHPDYAAAKSGNAVSGLTLAQQLLSKAQIEHLRELVGGADALLLPISALEISGFNAIPDAMAQTLSIELGWPTSAGEIVQSNKVGHTRARAFNRLVTPASFEGRVIAGQTYVLVDDHVGLGGTLANLKGFVETHGGRVAAMTTLTESREARHIALQTDTLNMLGERHGEELENLWREQFGHGLDCLTDVEARILCREPTIDAIRDRLAQGAVEASGRGLIPAV